MSKFIFQFILELLLAVSLLFNVFVLKNHSLYLPLISLIGFLILLLFLIKYRQPTRSKKNSTNFIVAGSCIVFLGVLYLSGFITSFGPSYNAIYKNYLTKETWILTFIIIVVSEITRYVLSLDKHQGKKGILSSVLMIANFCMIDYIILGSSVDFNNFYQTFELFLVFVIPTIAKHMLLNYLVKDSSDYVPCLLYRLFIDLYSYFLPYVPNVNTFLKTIALVMFPYVIYLLLKNTSKKQKFVTKSDMEKNRAFSIVSTALMFILIALVSCQFKYCMIAVGSESMTGAINKGDAVIYRKFSSENLQEGDIIVFRKNDMAVIHRISQVYSMSDGEEAYRTKGDANKSEDNWIVTASDIIGVVKARVLFVAWPSVIINELF